jgi:hypothetical protein
VLNVPENFSYTTKKCASNQLWIQKTFLPVAIISVQIITKSRDSSVGIALGYGLDDRGSRVRFPAGAGNFSLHHRVQNGSGAHPSSYPMGTRGSFPGVKRPGVKLTTHLYVMQRSKNEWSYTSTPQYAFMAWCSVKAQGQLYLYNDAFSTA